MVLMVLGPLVVLVVAILLHGPNTSVTNIIIVQSLTMLCVTFACVLHCCCSCECIQSQLLQAADFQVRDYFTPYKWEMVKVMYCTLLLSSVTAERISSCNSIYNFFWNTHIWFCNFQPNGDPESSESVPPREEVDNIINALDAPPQYDLVVEKPPPYEHLFITGNLPVVHQTPAVFWKHDIYQVEVLQESENTFTLLSYCDALQRDWWTRTSWQGWWLSCKCYSWCYGSAVQYPVYYSKFSDLLTNSEDNQFRARHVFYRYLITCNSLYCTSFMYLYSVCRLVIFS